MATIINEGVINSRLYSSEDWENNDDRFASHSKEMYVNQAGGLSEDVEKNMAAIAQSAKSVLTKRKPIYDWHTKNKSFIELYKDYQKLGIKNNKFFLKLYDRDLIGVDPYDPMLQPDVQLKIFLECIINPYYFLREVCRIPVDGMPIEPGGGSPFLADRNNMACWYCFLNGIDHYESKSRQLGKTQDKVAQFNYAFHFGAMSSTFLFFNKDLGLAKQNLYRLKCQRDMLPTWMQMKMSFKEDGSVDKGQDNITMMRNPITNNVIKVMPKATSQDAAIKLGRGETAAFYWNDEFDFTPWNTEILDAAAFAYSTAKENAIKHNSLAIRGLSSTPGYLNTVPGKEADKKIKRMLQWRDEFLDEPINKIQAIINGKDCNGFMYIEHTWKQLKKPYSWYQKQCGLVDYDTDKILREIELQRIQGNELSPFKKSALVYIAQHKKVPIERLDLDKNLNPILVYEKLNKKAVYVISIDPSEGLALNNNAFVIIDPFTQNIVAEYKSPFISPPDFYRMICKLIRDYIPKAMIVIENNRGRELINRFMESQFRFKLWYDKDKITDIKVANTDMWGAERMQSYQRRSLGFTTSVKTKPLLFSIIERIMEEELDKVCTEYMVKDVSSVQRMPNGKIILGAEDDDEGEGHGDVLMSYLIGLYVLYNAKNLEEFGIRPGMANPHDPDREMTRDEKRLHTLEILGRLPEDMQQIFKEALMETDPTESAEQYGRLVEMELRRQEEEQTLDTFNGRQGWDSEDFLDTDLQDRAWAGINQSMVDNRIQQDLDPRRRFNVDDWT